MAFALAFIPLFLALVVVFARRRRRPPILIDGSNVMFWRDRTASLTPVIEVVRMVTKAGFTPGVVFDADAGYKLAGRYLDEADLAQPLGIHARQVLLVPAGQPADPALLSMARGQGARIITNDRYRDWAGDYPEVTTPGHLIRGDYRNGGLWLDLGQAGLG